MSRASALIVAALGAASSMGEAPACTPDPAGGAPVRARDSAMLQARANLSHSPKEGHVRLERRKVGCFPRAAGDADDQMSFQDTTCVSAASRNNSVEPCRSGMPFFRHRMEKGESYLDCFTFCLFKGLDLSGLVHSELANQSECRCGATRANAAAWHESTPPPGLLLPDGSDVPEDSEHCEMVVWQYTGPLENNAVPTVLTELSTSDEAYIDGIVVGVDPHQIVEEDEPYEMTSTVHPDTLANLSANLSFLGTKGVCEDHAETGVGDNMPCSQAKQWCNAGGRLGVTVRGSCPMSCGICNQAWAWMRCYPYPCGPGGGPWTTKQGNIVYINYFYENLDADRRAGFEKARDYWQEKTCVRFVYSAATPRMRITVTNEGSCSAFVGFPGSDGTLDVNLGWCRSVRQWGNIAHELGHALGMNHEQNRPDATVRINTPAGAKGNYLRMKWYNVDAAWVPQWTGQRRSYYGSQTAGYAGYDYGSIMHYGLGDDADATNSAFQNVPGQRDELSDGDIRQFEDMYQCGASGPAPAPAPGPAPAGCEDYVNPWGLPCATWKARGDCATSQGIRQYCKVSCQQCSQSAPAPTPGPAPAGCEDYWKPWGLPCATWKARGDCATSQGIRKYCKVSCQQCSPSAGTGCTDTPGVLSYGYGFTCVDWAVNGYCSSSQSIQRACPGSCAEATKKTYKLTCAEWQKRGDCPGSVTLKRECPHLCGQCR